MQATYSTKELLDLGLACLPGTERSILRRADREQWRFIFETVRGGAQKRYLAHILPDDVREAILAHEQIDALVPVATGSNLPALTGGDDRPLCQEQQAKALAKADLLRLYLQALAAAPWGRKDQARDEFMVAYNSGQAWPKLFAALGALSWKTIEGWKAKAKKYRGDALTALGDHRGYTKRGTCALSPVHTEILLACALHPNKPLVSEAIRMAHAVMNARGIANGSSDATYRRWLTGWIERNYHIWVFNREGAKAWNDKCAYYIERDYNLINVGDILVADGHNLNFEILNPWTGKPKRMALILWKDMKSNAPLGWEIMPTEDTAAISSALRRAIIALGFIPKVAYLDNGRAFRARFFEGSNFDEAGFAGLYERLGMQTIHAWPYHGQSKTVERFFGTFAELERWCPSYTGTSIEHKPPRLNRGEKLHRRLHEKVTGGQPITLEQAHRAIAAWFDNYMQRPQRGHLNGQSPAQLLDAARGSGVDRAALSYLMMSMEIKTIHRNGISFLGQNYYHPTLYGRRHKVQVRYDLQDPSALYIFDEAGEYLCEATPVQKVHPAAAQLGTEEDRARLVDHIEHKKRQEKAASRTAREMLELHVLPEHQRRLEQMGVLPEPGQKPAAVKKIVQITQADAARIEAEAATITVENAEEMEWRSFSARPDAERYEHGLEMEAAGRALPSEAAAFMRYFEATQEFERDREYYEERRALYACAHQKA